MVRLLRWVQVYWTVAGLTPLRPGPSPKYRFRTSPQPGTRAKTIKVGLLFDMHFQEPERLRLPKPTPGMFFRHCTSMFTSLREFGPGIEKLLKALVQRPGGVPLTTARHDGPWSPNLTC